MEVLPIKMTNEELGEAWAVADQTRDVVIRLLAHIEALKQERLSAALPPISKVCAMLEERRDVAEQCYRAATERDDDKLAISHLATKDALERAIRSIEAGEWSDWRGHEDTASIAKWQRETFGEAQDPRTSWKRARKEFRELRVVLENPHDPKAVEEIADIVIVLSRIVAAHGKDLREEVTKKMAINRVRKWTLTGDGHGQHVEDGK